LSFAVLRAYAIYNIRQRADGQMAVKGFISYAHEDEDMFRKLHKQLRPFERAGKVSFWADRSIGAGDSWHDEISKALDAAQVALFLVSPDMFASDFILNVELPHACRRAGRGELIVIPVILHLCCWQMEFEGYCLSKRQAVPLLGKPISKHANPDEGYHDAAKRIMGKILQRFGGA
jgi:hypothetical protein